MRWIVFIVAAALVVELDHSLMHVLAAGDSRMRPVLSSALLAFVALTANRGTVPWAALVLGLMVDLVEPMAMENGKAVTLVGVHSLGYLGAGYVMMQLRTLVFPRRAVSIGFMTTVAHGCASLVVIAIFVIRSRYDTVVYPTREGALQEFFHQMLVSMYSGAVGVGVGWLLLKSLPMWGFQPAVQRMAMRRT